MSRTIPIARQADFESPRLTEAMCCLATRLDGQKFGFTDVDIDIPFTLTSGTYLFRAGALGITMSAAEATADLKAGNHEVKGILAGAGITQSDILAGKWDSCDLFFFTINYRVPSNGIVEESHGTIGNISTGDLSFTAEFIDYKQRLAANLLRTYSSMCDVDLFSTVCAKPSPAHPDGLDPEDYRQILTVLSSPAPTKRTATDSGRTEAAGYWADGKAVVLTGQSVGLKNEIKTNTISGDFTFLYPFFYGLEPGDTIDILPGCNKIGATGDCKGKLDNMVNHQGHELTPGPDATLAYVQNA